MPKMEDLEKVEVISVKELRQWFEANHKQTESIWLVTYKKSVPAKYVSIQEVLDEVLCFGWMDGRRMKLDSDRTMQLLSPRKTEHWSKTYKDRVAKLTQTGRMHEAGLKVVEAAKQNGAWDFLNDVDALIKPDDLVAALEQHPPALSNYEAFPDSAKRDILRWIKLAKKPETRANRIQKTAVLAAQNQRASGTR
ncbi:MAG: YdeI/OmpD-associated family protein [Cyanobacteria bacterium P01_H01_bin.153]